MISYVPLGVARLTEVNLFIGDDKVSVDGDVLPVPIVNLVEEVILNSGSLQDGLFRFS